MSCSIPHRHLWSAERLSAAELHALLEAATEIKRAKQRDAGWAPLRGRNLAVLAQPSDDAALSLGRAVRELGGTPTLLDTRDWQSREGTRMAEAARMLGRLYDAVDCGDLPPQLLEQIDAHCDVPVFNGLARPEHLSNAVGMLLTMREASGKPLAGLRLHIAGDPQSRPYQAVAALARLAAIELHHATTPPSAFDAPGPKPDFIVDGLSAAGTPHRLIVPEADPDTQARIAAMLDHNRRRALQALLVCSPH